MYFYKKNKKMKLKLVPFKIFTCTCFFILVEFIPDTFNLFCHKICHSFIISFGHFIPFGQSFLTGKFLWILIYPSYVPTLERIIEIKISSKKCQSKKKFNIFQKLPLSVSSILHFPEDPKY